MFENIFLERVMFMSSSELVISQNGIVLVDFYATWCGPCQMLSPVIDSIKQKNIENLEIIKVDIDENPEIASKYQVMSVPTLLFFCDGNLVKQTVGFMPEEKICSIIDEISKARNIENTLKNNNL